MKKVLTVKRNEDTGFQKGLDVLTDYEERNGRFKKNVLQVNIMDAETEEEESWEVQDFVDSFEHINGIYWAKK